MPRTTRSMTSKPQATNDQTTEDDKAKNASASPSKETPQRKRKATSTTSTTTTNTKTKKPDHQRITERDPNPLPKLWNGSSSSYTFKIISWNVAGLRAILKNTPDRLPNLVKTQNPDVLCLQETKLQDIHLDDPKLNLRELLREEGYRAYYNCATAKKGYSGTAVFVKGDELPGEDDDDDTNSKTKTKKQTQLGNYFTKPSSKRTSTKQSNNDKSTSNIRPTSISSKMNIPKHDSEGRIITVTYPLFTLVNLYVPNSGQNLDRLTYRTQQWDTDLLSYVSKHQQHQPVIYLGDLNVAHKSCDVWNDGAKHLAKSAGTTPEERESFTKMLEEGSFVDAFRYLHPEAEGWYTYWSQRAKNREPNKGLRLDYFVCSESLMKEEGSGSQVMVRDCYMMNDVMGSDHCPIVLEVEIKEK